MYRLAFLALFTLIPQAVLAAPNISLTLGDGAQGVGTGVQILIMLTILSVAPSIFLMTTSFVRFVIVFGMLRTAMGLGQLPPTQVLVGLSLILTFMVMQPTFVQINNEALQPFIEQKIDEKVFFQKAFGPLKDFMARQTDVTEIELALRAANMEKPESLADLPPHIMVVAYILSELKKAFKIGFMIFMPFIVIDMIVASALVSIGLMFLPPTTISLPFKIVLFVLIDGWALLSEGLMKGFA